MAYVTNLLQTKNTTEYLTVDYHHPTIIYKFSLLTRVFVPGKLFRPCPMFGGKARYYLSKESFRFSTLG
jgi:hypothetical protein